MNDNAPILPVDQLLHNAHALSFDAHYALAVFGVGLISVSLLYAMERWGAARARRRTERAIAAIERTGPPEART